MSMKIATLDTTVRESRILRGGAWHRVLIVGLLPAAAFAQSSFTWQQVKDKLEGANPTLKAAQLNIDESRAAEITAFLRPNPNFTGTLDQINPLTTIPSSVSGNSVYRPFANTLPFGSVSYLYEQIGRAHV